MILKKWWVCFSTGYLMTRSMADVVHTGHSLLEEGTHSGISACAKHESKMWPHELSLPKAESFPAADLCQRLPFGLRLHLLPRGGTHSVSGQFKGKMSDPLSAVRTNLKASPISRFP